MESILKIFDLTPTDLYWIISLCVLFLVVIPFLRSFIFTPLLAELEKREANTVGALAEAQRLRAAAAQISEEVETTLLKDRSVILKERDSIIAKAQGEAQAIISQAEAKIAAEFEKSQAQITVAVSQAKKDFAKDKESIRSTILEKLTFTALLVLLLTANTSFAAEGGEHHGVSSLFWYFINFAVFAGLIWYGAKSKLPGAWHTRRATIVSAIDKALLELSEAKKVYATSEKAKSELTANLKAQRDLILTQATLEARAIIEKAQVQSALLEERMHDELAASKRRDLFTLRRELVRELLQESAEKLMSDQSAVDEKLTGIALGQAFKLSEVN